MNGCARLYFWRWWAPSSCEKQLDFVDFMTERDEQCVGAGTRVNTGMLVEGSDLGLTILGAPVRTEYDGAAVNKGNTELADALKQGFAAVIADGTYAETLDKYGVSRFAMSDPIINGQSTHLWSEL